MKDGKSSARAKVAVGLACAAAVGALAFLTVEARGLLATASETSAAVPTGGPTAAASSATPWPPPPKRSETYSNIYKYDYVGPESCATCHPKNYQLWRSHPHSKMNRNANAASVVGDFSDAKLEYGKGSVVFSRDRGEFTMTLLHHEALARQYKVTRTVGSRFVQMYVGVQTAGPEPSDDPVWTREVKLPFAYWIERKEWFPQTYDENPTAREYDARGELTDFYAYQRKATTGWNQVCIKCHNTFPYVLRFDAAPESKLVGFPPGEITLKASAREAKRPHVGLPEIQPWELVTLGVSCESCHFGGREHAVHGDSISFLPESADIERTAPEPATRNRKSAHAVNSICHQCHAADPQGPIYPNGASSWNSHEAADLIGGACAREIACTDCHNPHEAGPTSAAAPDRPAQVESCVRCHASYRTPESAAAHASHPAGAKVSCLDCHMPRIVHGLAGMTRTHRISSPTDPRMLEGRFPNACNLCHLDRSIRWTLDALAARWGKKPQTSAGFVASDDPLGPAWLAHEVPVVRQVAAAAYARSPLGKDALSLVLATLNDDNPPTRMFGVLAVEGILGRRVGVDEYTPWAPPGVREKQIADLGRAGH